MPSVSMIIPKAASEKIKRLVQPDISIFPANLKQRMTKAQISAAKNEIAPTAETNVMGNVEKE